MIDRLKPIVDILNNMTEKQFKSWAIRNGSKCIGEEDGFRKIESNGKHKITIEYTDL